ncbi:hypothetical protein [uncultured Roseobacter sp.]|uniref:hypothetical protein n=1 Tax=uncultured Roseobacter sp. TaxID=114847 RepID=UPI00262292AA|nr:hypothetical protein [uncultured Roseobacter sp.]
MIDDETSWSQWLFTPQATQFVCPFYALPLEQLAVRKVSRVGELEALPTGAAA